MMRIAAMLLTTATMVAAQSAAQLDDATASDHAFATRDRIRWVVLTTIGPKNLAAGTFVAGINTWRDQPEDYSIHWDGFAQRYVNRLAAGGTSHVFEAGFGSLWGEDPRYFRAAGQPLRARLGHVVKMAFVTYNRSGDPQPAYARYIAVPAGILVSNTWQPDSPTTMVRVSLQVGFAFVSRIVGNAFPEFTPDLRDYFKHRRDRDVN
jgi:hypothetical protein